MREWSVGSQWVIEQLFSGMPAKKRRALDNTMTRNLCFTSESIPEHCYLDIYKEGWYFRAEGCQCKFVVWAFDRDGEFEFGRKPAEKTLHHIWTDSGSQYDLPWDLGLLGPN